MSHHLGPELTVIRVHSERKPSRSLMRFVRTRTHFNASDDCVIGHGIVNDNLKMTRNIHPGFLFRIALGSIETCSGDFYVCHATDLVE